MAWRIEVSTAAGKDLAALARAVAGRILDDRIASLDDPRGIGEALRGPVLGRF